jgi:hypothetical protein
VVASVAQWDLFEFVGLFITIERCRIVITQSCRSVCI